MLPTKTALKTNVLKCCQWKCTGNKKCSPSALFILPIGFKYPIKSNPLLHPPVQPSFSSSLLFSTSLKDSYSQAPEKQKIISFCLLSPILAFVSLSALHGGAEQPCPGPAHSCPPHCPLILATRELKAAQGRASLQVPHGATATTPSIQLHLFCPPVDFQLEQLWRPPCCHSFHFAAQTCEQGSPPSPQPSFGQPCLAGTSCTIGSTYRKARVRHQACSDFTHLSLVLWIKGRGVASLRFLVIFPAYVRGTSHADDISCLGRARLLKTRASWTRRADRNRCTSPHYSSPSANCCLSSSSSGNDVQLINPYQAAAEATKQLRLVWGSRNEAAHQCISAAASLPASKRTWKPSPASRGW